MQSTKPEWSYDDFKKRVKKEVEYRVDGLVSIQQITKNNGLELDGLTILVADVNISPTIYLNYYYDKFLQNGLDAVVKEILEVYEQNKPNAPIDISFFTDVEKVRSKIKMKIVNYERNREFLKKVPHKKFLDMAIIFYAEVENKPKEGLATIQIYNHHLSFWDLGTEELFELATKNMENDFRIESIFKTLLSNADDEFRCMIEAVEENFKMQLITNQANMYGAIGMLQSKLLKEFMERNKAEKLIIIPSSIHEVLLIPCDPETDVESFKEMVQEVNATQLQPEEVLSDNAYIYDGNEIKIIE